MVSKMTGSAGVARRNNWRGRR